MSKILVLGTGAWGSALASVLSANKHNLYLYSINNKEIADLQNGKNSLYFNGKMDNKPKMVCNDLALLAKQKPDFVLLAVPSTALNDVAEQLNILLTNKPIIINASKAFDLNSKQSADIEIKKRLTNKMSGFVKLVGPSFAVDVWNKNKTFVNVVSRDKKAAKAVANIFDNDYFICTYEPEEETVQFASTFKNVLAIACGLTWQLTQSSNTRAAIFSQGVKELSRVLKELKYKRSTLFNYSGLGDIYLTCTDTKSRNFMFGQAIGKTGVAKTIKDNHSTVEGYYGLKVLKEIVDKLKLEKCPIIRALYKVVYENGNGKEFLNDVMNKVSQQQKKFWKE